MLSAPIAVFFEIYFALYLLAISCRPVINPLAFRTAQFYQVIL